MDDKIYCLDANTGELIWSYTTGNNVWSSPAISNGKVYIGSQDNKIYCLDADTGQLIWTYTTGDGVSSSPAISNGKVYVGSCDNKIYCLDADTGELIWNYTTNDSVYSSPAISNGKVYVGSGDGKIYCLDANIGELIWSYTIGIGIFSSPAIADGKLYIGSMDGKVYCFEENPSDNPPLTPDKPRGPQNGIVGEVYNFTASTTDPDGDDVYYFFDWGDGNTSGWLGPYKSGEEVQANHSWSEKGIYKVKVKAKDIYGAESGWSDPLTVTVTRKSKSFYSFWFFQWLIDHFPLLERLLKIFSSFQ